MKVASEIKVKAPAKEVIN